MILLVLRINALDQSQNRGEVRRRRSDDQGVAAFVGDDNRRRVVASSAALGLGEHLLERRHQHSGVGVLDGDDLRDAALLTGDVHRVDDAFQPIKFFQVARDHDCVALFHRADANATGEFTAAPTAAARLAQVLLHRCEYFSGVGVEKRHHANLAAGRYVRHVELGDRFRDPLEIFGITLDKQRLRAVERGDGYRRAALLLPAPNVNFRKDPGERGGIGVLDLDDVNVVLTTVGGVVDLAKIFLQKTEHGRTAQND